MNDTVDIGVVAMLTLFSHYDSGLSTPFQLCSRSCWSVSPVVAQVAWLKNKGLTHVFSQKGTS